MYGSSTLTNVTVSRYQRRSHSILGTDTIFRYIHPSMIVVKGIFVAIEVPQLLVCLPAILDAVHGGILVMSED